MPHWASVAALPGARWAARHDDFAGVLSEFLKQRASARNARNNVGVHFLAPYSPPAVASGAFTEELPVGSSLTKLPAQKLSKQVFSTNLDGMHRRIRYFRRL